MYEMKYISKKNICKYNDVKKIMTYPVYVCCIYGCIDGMTKIKKLETRTQYFKNMKH